MTQNRKKLFFVIFACAALFLVGFTLSPAPHAFAVKPLENDYPKIPLTSLHFIGNYSLNDIWNRTGPFQTLDPLSGLIVYAFSLAVMLSGLVAFGALIYAGVMFMFSGAKPQLRADAKKKLWNAFIGIALLLGSVIILNTINPELKILTISTKNKVENFDFLAAPKLDAGSDPVALDSLQYGGVVLFASDKLDGAGGDLNNMSETVLNDIADFLKGAYISKDIANRSKNLEAIKILGNCSINVFGQEDFAGRLSVSDSLVGPNSIINSALRDTKSLNFRNTTCLGHSITAYSDDNYKGHTKIFLTNRDDFKGDTLSGHKGITQTAFNEFNLNDNIVSINFALENAAEAFKASLCANPLGANAQDDCAAFTADMPQLPPSLFKKASSVTFAGGANRQAGLILYKDAGFEDKSEVLIASDRNLQANFIKNNTVSSLAIIGKYKVTLYQEAPDAQWASNKQTLVFDNTGDSLTVINSFSDPNNERQEPIPTRQGGIVRIPDLTKYFISADTDWNDAADAIRIQVPKSIHDAQNLGGICQGDLCDL